MIEYVENVGIWFFHALIESGKLDRMAVSEEANHQNKPRTCHQFDSTFQIDPEGKGAFVTLAHLQPEHTVLLFGVHVFDSDLFTTDTSTEGFLFPTGAGIGPFLRPPVMAISPASFAIPDANNGRDWQTADLAAATDETGPSDWLLATMSQPHVAAGIDNFKAGMLFDVRTAGFDGQAPSFPGAATNYYVFWHALGSVAAYF